MASPHFSESQLHFYRSGSDGYSTPCRYIYLTSLSVITFLLGVRYLTFKTFTCQSWLILKKYHLWSICKALSDWLWLKWVLEVPPGQSQLEIYTIWLRFCGTVCKKSHIWPSMTLIVIYSVADPGFGLNIFYFKRKGITNKHKAYEWLSMIQDLVAGGVNCHKQGRRPCSRHEVASGGECPPAPSGRKWKSGNA